uniref:Uncharacterized protein n=1 Tax=Solanum tuberosum TaxID=4113 RepID=M1D4A1_SOLTU
MGDKVDLLVRLGLLKLVNAVSGLIQEGLPETLQLNFFRLRATQAKNPKDHHNSYQVCYSISFSSPSLGRKIKRF